MAVLSTVANGPPVDANFFSYQSVPQHMTDELPAELHPEDLPDDPEVLKRLVCDLYTTVMASEELIKSIEGGPPTDGADLGWLNEHLEAGSPAGHEPQE